MPFISVKKMLPPVAVRRDYDLRTVFEANEKKMCLETFSGWMMLNAPLMHS